MISHTAHCATTLRDRSLLLGERGRAASLLYLTVDDALGDHSHKILRDHPLPLGERGRAASLIYLING